MKLKSLLILVAAGLSLTTNAAYANRYTDAEIDALNTRISRMERRIFTLEEQVRILSNNTPRPFPPPQPIAPPPPPPPAPYNNGCPNPSYVRLYENNIPIMSCLPMPVCKQEQQSRAMRFRFNSYRCSP